MKKSYTVEITETLTKLIEVEASSKNEAIKKVTAEYHAEVHILDSNDFSGVEINIV